MEIEILLKEVGEKVKSTRKEKKLSRNQLAESCNLDYDTICKIESGKEDADIITLSKIAGILEVDVKDFM